MARAAPPGHAVAHPSVQARSAASASRGLARRGPQDDCWRIATSLAQRPSSAPSPGSRKACEWRVGVWPRPRHVHRDVEREQACARSLPRSVVAPEDLGVGRPHSMNASARGTRVMVSAFSSNSPEGLGGRVRQPVRAARPREVCRQRHAKCGSGSGCATEVGGDAAPGGVRQLLEHRLPHERLARGWHRKNSADAS